MRNSFLWLLLVVGVIAVFLYYVGGRIGGTTEEPISTVIELAKQEGAIQKIEVRDRDLTVITATGEIKSRLPEDTDILTLFRSEGVELGTSGITIDAKGSSGFGSFLRILLNFLPLIFFGGLILFMMRQAQGSSNQAMGFGRSKAKLWMVNRSTVTFADVAGVEEAKQELEEVVEYLKYKERFLSLGARIPKGVLLVGQPGTGKTLLAKAVAGEAGAPFFSISGSEFVEMFVGVGAARVRDLFDQARRNSPCIVFVDEIDAVGRHRGAGVGGGHDEREQTLNQILVEMDGFDTDTNIIIIAATNRPDILDPALLRPGRFDRRVVLDLPELVGRTAILKVHSNGKPLGPDVSLEVLAKQTPGFSGADLSNLVNEAALLAARANKKLIGMTEFEESIDRVIAGPERKSRIISAREKEMTAYHEAGHALVAWKLPHADAVHKISIVARGGMGGYTRLLPDEDRYLMTKNQFEDMLATSLGGRISEEIVFEEITTGASNDLENATRIALRMIKQYGMSDTLGLRTFGRREELVFLGKEIHEERDYSDKVAEDIDQEVQALIDQAYARAKDILTTSRDKLDEVANYLIKNETVEGDDLKRLFDGLPLEPEVTAPVADSETSETPAPPVIAPAPGPFPQPNPTMPSSQDQGASEAQPS